MLKVLYADSSMLVILMCYGFLKDNTCDPHTQHFFVLTRETEKLDLVLKLQDLQMIATNACVDFKSLIEPNIGKF